MTTLSREDVLRLLDEPIWNIATLRQAIAALPSTLPQEPTPDMCFAGGAVEIDGILLKRPDLQRACVGMKNAESIYRAMIAALPVVEQEPVANLDLIMLVRRLVRALKNAQPDSDAADNALDYLQRIGHGGNPLRAEQPTTSAEREERKELAQIIEGYAESYKGMESVSGFDVAYDLRNNILPALTRLLRAPQQQAEPVAWQQKVAGVWANCPSEPEWEPGIEVRALYAAPPPDDESVRLLREEDV